MRATRRRGLKNLWSNFVYLFPCPALAFKTAGLSDLPENPTMEVVREMETAKFYFHRLLREAEREDLGEDDLDAAKVRLFGLLTFI